MYLRLLRESLTRRRGRALAAAAVALGTATLTALLSLGLVVGDRLAEELRSYGANIRVEPAGEDLPLEFGGVDLRPLAPERTLDEAALTRLRKIFWRNNLVAFTPFLPVRARVEGADATLVGTWFEHPVDAEFRTGLRGLSESWSVEGRWPADGAREAMLGERLAERLGLRPGDRLKASWRGRPLDLEVVGTFSSGESEDEVGYLPLDVAQGWTGQPGRFRSALVSAITTPESRLTEKYGLDPTKLDPEEYDRWYCTPYVSSIAHQIAEAIPDSQAGPLRKVTEGEARVMGSLQGVMWGIGLTACLASALAVGATLTATLQERRREMALLRTLGAGRTGVVLLFLGEAAALGLAGGTAGFLLGSLLGDRVGLAVFGAGVPLQLVLLPLVLGAAVLLAAAGTAVVLREVLADSPSEVLRGRT